MNKTVFIAMVDDHVLLRHGLSALVDSFSGYKVVFEADNGRDFIKKLQPNALPDIVLMDITMPEMDGYETANWLRTNYPEIKVLALSMLDDEKAIIKMLKSGAKGYLLKDSEPHELKKALDTLTSTGTYFNELISNRIILAMNSIGESEEVVTSITPPVIFRDKEIELIRFFCTEKMNKEIADEMNVSPRTVDSMRDGLFLKLGVKSRVGIVMYAIKNGIVEL